MILEKNTTKKKWVTPKRLGLAAKQTQAGNTYWLPEGSTSRSTSCSTNTYSNHTYPSTTSPTTRRTCYTFTSTGQS